MKIRFGSMLAALALIGLALAYPPGDRHETAAQTVATPTPYHEGFPSPAATPTGDEGHTMPLPAPADRDTANSMTDAGNTMIRAAQSMEAAADLMVASGNPTLTEIAEHWYQDARALRERGAWMVVTATSDSMIHDPSKARQVNLMNLRANGMVMEAEGQAMAQHGRAMIAQIDQILADGSLPAAMADELKARGNELIASGEQIAQDGKRAQEEAEQLLRSLGK